MIVVLRCAHLAGGRSGDGLQCSARLASLPGPDLGRASKHARLASAGMSRLEADSGKAEAAPHGMIGDIITV